MVAIRFPPHPGALVNFEIGNSISVVDLGIQQKNMLSLGRDVLRPQKFTGSEFADMEYLYEWIMTGMFVLSLSAPFW